MNDIKRIKSCSLYSLNLQDILIFHKKQTLIW